MDSIDALKLLPDNSVNLTLTSPPYALHFKKAYGNASKENYADWFIPFAKEIFRVLTDNGSFVLNIGGSYNPKVPTRSLYHYKLLIRLVDEVGFHLAQECYWYNPAKMPLPAEWVTVRKIRIKDSVEHVWWLSKTPWPKASNQKVLKDSLSPDMHRLNARGLKETTRPGGYKINESWAQIKKKGAIPSNFVQAEFFEEAYISPENVLIMGNNAANDQYTTKCKEQGVTIHPARFPRQLPEFFIKMLTDENDLVLDPFSGSNTTGAVAESLSRRWIAFDEVEEYVAGSRFRFGIE
ncbi:site-specific DNA-methyltransferase [Azospirillum sp. Sh1]|uniref:DNA-methyltransferase n=1 Tax=Azospirillum sp. Sh1 TaxID=2607285 RepID=UPI001B3B72E2|nr:site-specific DNA-methyltransferase [Azospirillum sp. Sh1]